MTQNLKAEPPVAPRLCDLSLYLSFSLAEVYLERTNDGYALIAEIFHHVGLFNGARTTLARSTEPSNVNEHSSSVAELFVAIWIFTAD